MPKNIVLSEHTKIILNGDWLGVHCNPQQLVDTLKSHRRSGEIDNEISISFFINHNEVRIYTDTGRCSRPLYIVENNKVLITQDDIQKLKDLNQVVAQLLKKNQEMSDQLKLLKK